MSVDKRVQEFEEEWSKMDRLHDETKLVGPVNDPGFTVAEYATHYEINVITAAGRLRNMSREGKLIPGWRTSGRSKLRVYRFPE